MSRHSRPNHSETVGRILWAWDALEHWGATVERLDLTSHGIYATRELMRKEERRVRALSELRLPWAECFTCQEIRARIHVWSPVYDRTEMLAV